jgi:uncharacterized membrane protein YgcG
MRFGKATATLTVAVLVLLGFAAMTTGKTVAQSDWRINSFRASYVLADSLDGTMDVSESIDTYFSIEKHGITRDIPDRYNQSAWQPAVDLGVRIKSVTDSSGATYPYRTSRANGYVDLEIGDPQKYVYGAVNYTIDYSLKNAIKFFNDHDELYWDVNGTDWPVDTDEVSVVITVPAAIRAQVQGTKCYTGGQGSTASNCTIDYDETSGKVSAKTDKPLGNFQNLSVVVSFNKGSFVPPSFLKKWGPYLLKNIGILLPLAVAWFAYKYWDKHGRDPKSRGIFVPQYSPPDGLKPAEMGTVADYTVDDRDISGTIIDLAIRGIIRIEDTTGSQKKKKRKYTFHLLKDDLKELKDYEQEIVSGLFGDIHAGTSVKMSELKNKFYLTTEKAKSQLYKSLTADGYFAANPKKAKNGTRTIGIIFLAGSFYTFSVAAQTQTIGWTLGLAFSGLVLLVFARYMPARTEKGLKVWEDAEGLKMYMDLAEKDRLEVMQGADSRYVGDTTAPKYTVELFEKLLPYAVVMGVEKSWASKFKDIYTNPPDWYQGDWTTFNTALLASNLSNGINSMNTTLASRPSSSSSSGFGGGGFSGGGFGGGGGGSW